MSVHDLIDGGLMVCVSLVVDDGIVFYRVWLGFWRLDGTGIGMITVASYGSGEHSKAQEHADRLSAALSGE